MFKILKFYFFQVQAGKRRRGLLTAVFTLCILHALTSASAAKSESARLNSAGNQPKTLLYLPLDERFTTRDLFLSFADLTDYRVATPEKALLPEKKKLPEMKALIEWTMANAPRADAAIISADMLLYGGLIASRTSADSLAEVRARLQRLEEIHRQNPRLPIFVSSTVMRMPQYSSADEEPDYYARYGREIFLYSEYAHRYEALKNPADQAAAENYKNKIPPEILNDYLDRRARNFQINRDLIALVKKNVINRLVITLDDNAEYGLFKKEAAALEQLAAGFADRIAIYPGADEAQLPLLSRLALAKKRVPVFVAYRFPESRRLIPSFEGQALEKSVAQQISAAGGRIVANPNEAVCIVYVNNFQAKQTFAGAQVGLETEKLPPLQNLLEKNRIPIEKGKIYILADNRFYNGADVELIDSIFSGSIGSEQIAYAGWNTSGNTLGTAVALGFLRQRTKDQKLIQSVYKKLLWTRFVEDWLYMVEGREDLKSIMKQRNISVFAGTALEPEFASRMQTFFNARSAIINRFLGTDYSISRVYFPWHRHFEISFESQRKNQ